ncbi:MAG: Gfo/Idh/MocA family oxidoreductase [Pseudomonadota bacterium]
MSALRVACAGAGYFAQFHYQSWFRMERASVVGACDLDQARAEATGAPAFADLSAMLKATNPDLLDIILPPTAHAAAIETAIVHKVPTLICQKPFCTDLPEARRMVEAAEKAGTRVIIHENFRFQPWYRALHKELQASRIGQPQQITFRLRPGDGQGAEAYLDRQPYFQTMKRFLVHETAVHWLDTFRYLCGDAVEVYADLRQVNPVIAGEDAGVILMTHQSGVRTIFDGNRCLDHAADNLRRTMGEALVEGDKGTIRLKGDGSLWLRAFGGQAESCLLNPDQWNGFGGDCVHALQSHVVAGLLDDTPLENSARDYLQVLAVEEAVYQSAETGRKITLTAPA